MSETTEMIKEFKKGDLLYSNKDGKAYWGFPEGYPYKEGETIHPMAPEFLPYATSTTYGAVKQMSYLPNAEGDAPTAENFNQLVRELKSAGLMHAK